MRRFRAADVRGRRARGVQRARSLTALGDAARIACACVVWLHSAQLQLQLAARYGKRRGTMVAVDCAAPSALRDASRASPQRGQQRGPQLSQLSQTL
mmetsp:Transcript_72130/g.160387  ORF Transcript_72130/g.160387 Transcript_72130/m.160387 type:complete len:97 (+) Transcript_72130:106-396(+)